jgi:ribosomal protein S18 acetylase RimI-like enzyme
MSIKIQRINSNDATLFLHVAEEVFDELVIPTRLAAYLADSSNLMIIASAHGEIIGQVAAVIHCHPDKPTELYIDEVGVTPRYRRQGIATKMMEEMMRWGEEQGCQEAWVGTEPDNAPARALYRRRADASPIVIYEWDI